jgi:hypothetical protein
MDAPFDAICAIFDAGAKINAYNSNLNWLYIRNYENGRVFLKFSVGFWITQIKRDDSSLRLLCELSVFA